jgi:hypothetical protein
MNNISIFKKIRLFRFFRKIINDNSISIERDFGLRIDNANRMYTVINIPEDVIGDAFSLKKSDIDRISENYIKEYTSEVTRYLTLRGLGELLSFYEVRKVDKYSYLIVIGFSLFKSNKYYDRLYWRVYPMIVLLIIISSIFLLNF